MDRNRYSLFAGFLIFLTVFSGCTHKIYEEASLPAEKIAVLSTEATHVPGTFGGWTYPSFFHIDGKSTIHPPFDHHDIQGNRYSTFEVLPGEHKVGMVFVQQSGSTLFTWTRALTVIKFDTEAGRQYAFQARQDQNKRWTLTIIDKTTGQPVPYRF